MSSPTVEPAGDADAAATGADVAGDGGGNGDGDAADFVGKGPATTGAVAVAGDALVIAETLKGAAIIPPATRSDAIQRCQVATAVRLRAGWFTGASVRGCGRSP